MIRIWLCIFLLAVTKAQDGNETVAEAVTQSRPLIAMCGNRLYLVEQSLCCQGDVILPKPNEFIECCAGSRYDSRFYVCCGENVVFGKHGACCEDKWGYDDRTHLCCGGQLMEKPHPQAYCCYGRICIGPAGKQ